VVRRNACGLFESARRLIPPLSPVQAPAAAGAAGSDWACADDGDPAAGNPMTGTVIRENRPARR
jgi:hypothetical protein